MSRARESTHAWVVADDLAQAADDLRRDWSARRTPTWALDAGLAAVSMKEAVVSLATPDHARAVALALARTRTSAGSIGHLRAPDFSSDGHLSGILPYPWTPLSGLPSLTVHRLPATITARTSNQFRANAGGLWPSLR
jgi:hypothetical protein